jgi:uncharacterized protein
VSVSRVAVHGATDEALPTPSREVSKYARSRATEPYWQALGEGRLLVPWCSECEASFFPPTERCPRCWSDSIVWRQASGRGTIRASAVVRLALNDWPADDLPYQAVLVCLDEGITIPGRLLEPVTGSVLGEPVELVFSPSAATELPRFKLLSAT